MGSHLQERLDAEVELLSSRGAAEANSDRLHRAADTVTRMQPSFARFGITRLAEVTHLDLVGIPVWMTVRPNARTLAVSQGKGLSDSAAQASAVMEAVELAVAEDPPIAVEWRSADALGADGHVALTLQDLLARGSTPAADCDVIAWAEGFNLFTQERVWVPAEAVSLSDKHLSDARQRMYWQSSDGLASGNLLLEAIVHGLCERIERDACVLWRFRSPHTLSERCVSPTDLEDDAVADLATSINSAGLELRLFDITSDIGVPTFLATISPTFEGATYHSHFEFASGSGCHPRASRAAIRAITEAAQTRVTSITGARDDYDPKLYRKKLAPDLLAYLRARPSRAAISHEGAPDHPGRNLSFLLRRLEAAGIRSAIVVPLKIDKRDFSVAKVIVPGLEHPPGDRRFRFGRRALRAMARLQ